MIILSAETAARAAERYGPPMVAWSFLVLVLLAPIAFGGLLQLVLVGPSPGTALAVVAGLGVAGAVKRIREDGREVGTPRPDGH